VGDGPPPLERARGTTERRPALGANRGYVSDRDNSRAVQDGRYVDEAVSAFRVPFRQRPAAGRLHLQLQRGDWLYIAYLDRAFRSWTDLASMFAHWKERGVRVIFCEPYIDLGLWTGELLAQVMGMVAWLQSTLLSNRIGSRWPRCGIRASRRAARPSWAGSGSRNAAAGGSIRTMQPASCGCG
jgi:hypothetical protein